MDLGSMLLTGGTGSFGRAFARYALDHGLTERLVIYSRDELKQSQMREEFGEDPRMRFFLGDVRDRGRLRRALHGVSIVVHAAALKQVPACEQDPFEAVQTNILGAQNVIDAALDTQVARVLALSTDKACAPVNLYGATKCVAERLFTAANVYAGGRGVRFSCLRYGNVTGSRGSVIPVWLEKIKKGEPIPITDARMSRFWFTLDDAVEFTHWALDYMLGGEVFVPKMPFYLVSDLATALAPNHPRAYVGLRQGEKLHESMVSPDEAPFFWEWQDRFVRFLPGQEQGKALPEGFFYRSGYGRPMEIVELWDRLRTGGWIQSEAA